MYKKKKKKENKGVMKEILVYLCQPTHNIPCLFTLSEISTIKALNIKLNPI